MEKILENISKSLQDVLESTFSNYPSGVCYLTGHLMAEILKRMGYDAFEVTGSFALKTKANKFIIYGDRKLKGLNVGDYHTWCEVETDKNMFIVDPSIKYNKVTLRNLGYKVHSVIPNTIITTTESGYYFRYIEDKSKVKYSKSFLEAVDQEVIEKLIIETIDLSKTK